MKNLVIVESPTKARTLSQYLGKDYVITASMGHVRDLPRGEFGVDVEHNFKPKYVIPKEKIKAINVLVKDAASAENLWLASDPDREGEAIAWNILEAVKEKGSSSAKASADAKALADRSKDKKGKNPNYHRVVFHEITKEAVMDAFDHPRKIDDDLVNAQQGRRILDRLVGYKLSPLLWKKVKSGLSAGRVQSVALRLVVDKEREIEAFKPAEYWDIGVEVSKVSKVTKESSSFAKASEDKKESDVFSAKLIQISDRKAEVGNGEQAGKIVEDLENADYKVLEVKSKDTKKYPNPPFTTSTLQQAAAGRMGYTPKRTMRIAQDLYEKGYITYMRTDSVNLSPQAVSAARKYIEEKFGKNYLPPTARHYKAKSRLAQEAHEAIRPTAISVDSSQLSVDSNDHRKIYDLIWKRMVVCQMAEAVVAETTVDVSAKQSGREIASSKTPHNDSVYILRATGQKVKFDGWYKVYEKPPVKDQLLPDLKDGEDLDLIKVNSQQKFTEPPSRYTEATLIRDLEKNDIGRPSTYAPTISTLYERVYIEKLEDKQSFSTSKKIGPTPVAKIAMDFLVKYFPEIVDLKFTAKMEEDLDKIARGEEEMVRIMKQFWVPFEKQIEKVTEEAEKMKVEVEETDIKCEKCGKPMVIRYGRFGKFLACSGFPECKNTKALTAPTGLICPEDGGEIVQKRTKKGRMFWGCANWPKCKFASWTKPTPDKTPEVNSDDKGSESSKSTKSKAVEETL